MVKEELHFRYEAASTRRMRKLLKRHDIYVPRVFQDISTSRILVTEFIDGVLVSDYIRVSQQDPERIRRWCLANNVDPKKVGKRLFQSAKIGRASCRERVCQYVEIAVVAVA